MEFKAAICPNCGGDLQLPDDKKVLKCMYCGKDIIVEDAIKKATPSVESYLKLGRTAKAAKNNKEAYDYYNKVLELDPTNVESWLGKAECASWQSTINEPRVQELITNFEKAIECSSPDIREETIKQGTQLANIFLVAYYDQISKYMLDSGLLTDVRETYYQRCKLIVSALEILNHYNPNDMQIIENIIFICQQQIVGVEYNPAPGQHAVFKAYSDVNLEYKAKLTSAVNNYTSKGKKIDPNFIPPEVNRRKTWNF